MAVPLHTDVILCRRILYKYKFKLIIWFSKTDQQPLLHVKCIHSIDICIILIYDITDLYLVITLLGRPVHQLVNANINEPIMSQQLNAKKHDVVKRFSWFQTKCQNGEEMWSKWLWPWGVCWWQTGWFEYLRNGWSPGFSRTTVSRVCREWCEKQKTSSEQQFCGQKCVVNERGQGRRAWLSLWLVKADRKVRVAQIMTHHNSSMQKSISEHTMRQTS